MLSSNPESSLNAFRQHLNYGQLGDLIFDRTSPFSVEKYPEIVAKYRGSTRNMMFDNAFNEWVPFDPDHVPWTYMYAPRPRSVLVELDYFRRSVGLVKFKYIWVEQPEQGMHREIFSMIASRTNRAFLGRFTVTRNMPSILHIG